MKTIIITFLLMSCSVTQAKYPELKTVDSVNLERYIGTWFEVARFDQKFQKGCTATKALYSKKANGTIKVVNECRLNSPTGKLKRAAGRAWVEDKKTNAKLKVQFFLSWLRIGLFAGDYWIIELDEDNYSYAVIGDPSRNYLWILSRTPKMDEGLYQELVARAKGQFFDTSKLLRTEH